LVDISCMKGHLVKCFCKIKFLERRGKDVFQTEEISVSGEG
jgi:hypothetical protein